MAVEPYVRRTWPKLMVSWQRLLGGRFRDPLVGRDVLLGTLAGAAIGCVLVGANGLLGISEAIPVTPLFGRGLGPTVGYSVWQPSIACFTALVFLAILSITTGILRRRWLGLIATALILEASFSPKNAVEFALGILYVFAFLAVLTRLGLVATASFLVVWQTLALSPPLDATKWYAGRAMIALLIPVGLVVFGFYVSVGGRPILGNALRE